MSDSLFSFSVGATESKTVHYEAAASKSINTLYFLQLSLSMEEAEEELNISHTKQTLKQRLKQTVKPC